MCISSKQARRRDDDIAIVNGAFHYTLDEEKKITNAKMAFGGMSFVTKMALNTAEFLQNKPWVKLVMFHEFSQYNFFLTQARLWACGLE